MIHNVLLFTLSHKNYDLCLAFAIQELKDLDPHCQLFSTIQSSGRTCWSRKEKIKQRKEYHCLVHCMTTEEFTIMPHH